MRPHVFVVDDDADHLAALADLVEAGGYAVTAFQRASEAMQAIGTTPPDALVTDLRMPGMDGFSLLDAIATKGCDVPVIMITGHGDIAHAVRAIQLGAEDFLEKPYDAGHLLSVLGRATRAGATRAELARLQAAQFSGAAALLGDSPAIAALRDRITAMAPLDVDVLLTGETGTGKELAARALHTAGPRGRGPFIALNCAALPEHLFEIEVFGHAAGAFPGAQDRAGKLEAATGGTLMLDEVEAMALPLQAKLLRVLQERQIERLGENHLRPLDLRIIATSKTDLRRRIEEGSFRSDLYFRLAGAEITLPPLRNLGPDIALIFTHYATLAARRYGRDPRPPDFTLRRDLMRHDWPGNVRELRLAAERHALGLEVALALPDAPTLAERVADYEAREIRAALDRARGQTERAAQDLGLPRRTLADKMTRYGIRT